MHENQYRDYKSGIAKERFNEEINKLKSPKTTVAVKEKQPPNRSSYNKDKAPEQIAMIAFLLPYRVKLDKFYLIDKNCLTNMIALRTMLAYY